MTATECLHARTKIWEPHLAGARKCLDCGMVYNPNFTPPWSFEAEKPTDTPREWWITLHKNEFDAVVAFHAFGKKLAEAKKSNDDFGKCMHANLMKRDMTIEKLKAALEEIAKNATDDELPDSDSTDEEWAALFQKISEKRRRIAREALASLEEGK